MSRRRRLFIVVTTIGAFIVGFMFAWNVFNPTPSAADPGSIQVESAPVNGDTAAVRDELQNGVSESGGNRPIVAADDGAGSAMLDGDCAGLYGRFVSVHDGYVAIFAGAPDGCRELIETRPQQVTHLLPFQIDDLLRGVVFHDDDELFQILEGLVAP